MGTIQFASIHGAVVLLCKPKQGAKDLRWRRDNFILTNGQQINKGIAWHSKLQIDVKTDQTQYNLRINNVTAGDFGVYLCEMQVSKTMSRQTVTLKCEGKLVFHLGKTHLSYITLGR